MQRQTIITIMDSAANTVAAGGIGLRLEPLTNANTGNPVAMSATLRLNRNTSLVYEIEDDGPRYFSEPFQVAELVGARVGDRWRVTVFEGVEDAVGPATRRARQTPVLLEKDTWSGIDKGKDYYLTGASGGATDAVETGLAAVIPLDVSRYRTVHVYAGAAFQKDAAYPSSNPAMIVAAKVLAGPRATAANMGGAAISMTSGRNGLLVISETTPTVKPSAVDLEWATLTLRPGYLLVVVNFTDFAGATAANPTRLPGTFIRVLGLE